MNGFVIALIIISSIAFLYVFGFAMNIGFIAVFLRKLDLHKKALTIVLSQKYDAEAEIISLFNKNNIKLSKENVDIFNKIDIHNFSELDSLECLRDRTSLSYLRQELLSAVKNKENFLKNEQFQRQVSIINNCDEQFRFLAASYNADVIGYNYWIRFKPYKYFFLLNRVELKNIIS